MTKFKKRGNAFKDGLKATLYGTGKTSKFGYRPNKKVSLPVPTARLGYHKCGKLKTMPSAKLKGIPYKKAYSL